MLSVIHRILIGFYVVAPVAAMLVCLRKRSTFRAGFLGSIVLGLAIGTGMEFAHAAVAAASVRWTQLLLTAYLATALLLILKGFDLFVCNLLAHVFFSKWFRPRWIRQPAAFVIRFVVLCAVVLPYLMAVGATYRPKVNSTVNPQTVFHADYQDVSFTTSDGVRVGGWWIPSSRPRALHANQTILLCPGLGGDMSSQLELVKELIPEQYNVLVIDFRAHGRSAGQLCTFGDLERFDVLAAVHWLRTAHAKQAEKIFGVGTSTGAAALIAAAAARGADGQAIAAIVAYSPYARLSEWADDVAAHLFSHPVDRWIVRASLPMAGAQTGADLTNFSPAKLVSNLWPRPILIIHSEADEIIPWEQGDELYRAASFPKDRYWLETETHAQSLKDPVVAKYVVEFLNGAQAAPVI